MWRREQLVVVHANQNLLHFKLRVTGEQRPASL